MTTKVTTVEQAIERTEAMLKNYAADQGLEDTDYDELAADMAAVVTYEIENKAVAREFLLRYIGFIPRGTKLR